MHPVTVFPVKRFSLTVCRVHGTYVNLPCDSAHSQKVSSDSVPSTRYLWQCALWQCSQSKGVFWYYDNVPCDSVPGHTLTLVWCTFLLRKQGLLPVKLLSFNFGLVCRSGRRPFHHAGHLGCPIWVICGLSRVGCQSNCCVQAGPVVFGRSL